MFFKFRKNSLLLVAGLLFSLSLQGQEVQDLLNVERLLEQFEGVDLPESESRNAFLEDWAQSFPLNLNTLEESDLRQLVVLNDAQIRSFLNHRQKSGPFIAKHELQAIANWDTALVRLLWPYFTIETDLDDYQVGWSKLFFKGASQLNVHWSRQLEPLDNPSFAGNQDRLYLRYRYRYANRLSWGIALEKDPGELFIQQKIPFLFDHYSYHFFLKDYRKRWKALALGDFNVSLGQGLILHAGYGYGKSGQVMNVIRHGEVLRPQTTANEGNFFRGGGATVRLGENWEATTFISYRKRDASLRIEGEEAVFSTFDLDGLHRTSAERAAQKAVGHFSAGGNLQWKKKQLSLSANVLLDAFSHRLSPTERFYNRYYFRGRSLFNGSLDYRWRVGNFLFFGETAIGPNGGPATLNGLTAGLAPQADLALVFRHYPSQYQALRAQAFGESSGNRNETGLYLASLFRLSPAWTAQFFVDLYQHPEPKFGINSPSQGWEIRSRLQYEKRHRHTIYLEFRRESKQIESTLTEQPLPPLVFQTLTQLRWHLALKTGKAFEFRTRLDVGSLQEGNLQPQYGMSIFQDVLYRPVGKAFSFTTRFALFDTRGYDLRFYHYENNLLGAFSLPAYYHSGSRFYFNLRYRPYPGLTIEGRLAQTIYTPTGNDTPAGNTKSQLALQLQYLF